MLLPNDKYTFISSSHSTTSWLDHILSTFSRHSLLQDAHFKGNFISMQITCHSDSLLLLIMQLIVCMILVVTITIKCSPLTRMVPRIMIYGYPDICLPGHLPLPPIFAPTFAPPWTYAPPPPRHLPPRHLSSRKK